MKYIDADKLIKSVDNYREGAKAALNPIDGDADYYRGKIDACKDMQELIADHQKLPFPQSHWKPSEDEITAIEVAVKYLCAHTSDEQLRENVTSAFRHLKQLPKQENEIVELSFKGGTYRKNGEEHAFKGGKAKVIILEINQEEDPK